VAAVLLEKNTPGRTAFVESATVPVRVALLICANAAVPKKHDTTTQKKNLFIFTHLLREG